MKLEVGKKYQTRKSGLVEITEDLGAGRKRYIGKLSTGTLVGYFRTGGYSNSSRAKSGHAYDIISDIPV